MNKYINGLFILLFIFQGTKISNAQSADYSIVHIPLELLSSANAVIRYNSLIYTVDTKGAKEERKFAVTVMNDYSSEEEFYIPYGPNSKVKKVKARLYNALGQEIRKMDKDEMKDRSAVSHFSVYEDFRYKHVEFSHKEYPYTIEYEYEIEHDEVLFYPSFRILPHYQIAAQKSFFQLKLAKGIEVGYKIYNGDYLPIEGQNEGFKTLTWDLENIPAIRREPYAPRYTEVLPMIAVQPKNIYVEGLSGDLSNWEAYGDFMYRLNENRDQLSPQMVREVEEMTAHAKSNAEKIEILYRYMQDHMRYVSVQLGIGGWKTFDAQYVEKNKFGDCKALSNFMKSLLKAVGIEAHVALVYGGEDPPELEADFPIPGAFNHVILNIPKEDCWLECTSNRNPVNHMGRFTGNRQALLLMPEGGELVGTPVYTAEDNLQHSQGKILLAADGSATIQNSIHCYGARYDRYNQKQEDLGEKKLHQWFVGINDDLPTFDIEELNIKTTKDKPESGVDYRLTIQRYASKAGRRLFLQINSLNTFDQVPPQLKKRQLPIRSRQAFTDVDEYEIQIPEGYEVESIPEQALHLQTDYGNYELKIEQNENQLTYYRKLQIFPVALPADLYDEFRGFYKDIASLEKMKVVLVKKKT